MGVTSAGLGRRSSETAAALWRSAREPVLGLAAGAAAWEWAGHTLGLGFLPPLSRVASAGAALLAAPNTPTYIGASVAALLTGFGLATGAGLVVGMLMGRFRAVDHALQPLLGAFLAAPNLAFVPILFALFGAGRGVQVSVVFMSAFFVIVANTMSGVRHVDAQEIEMARSFGATDRQLFVKVMLPSSMPLVMAGLRVGLGRAVKGMINGEMFVAVIGLGGLLRTYGNRFDSEKVFAILLMVIAIALIGQFLLSRLERRVTAWTETTA